MNVNTPILKGFSLRSLERGGAGGEGVRRREHFLHPAAVFLKKLVEWLKKSPIASLARAFAGKDAYNWGNIRSKKKVQK